MLAHIGASPGGGINRLAFTAEEREAHSYVAARMREAGLTVRGDAIGNTFGCRPGGREGLPAIVLGSHLDSIYEGGQFDGTVGVVGALEAVRALNEQNIATLHPIIAVAFAAEEGARFGASNLGSRALVGDLPQEELRRLHDGNGTSVAVAIQQLGFPLKEIPTCRWDSRQVGAFVELHIEQSAGLETLRKPVGIVDAIGAATRLRINLIGRPDHSGATSMSLRRDALAAAAEIVLNVERIARETAGRNTVATVGKLNVKPGVITVVPGEVEMDIDIRDIDADMKDIATSAMEAMVHEVARRRGIQERIELLTHQLPSTLAMWTREAIRGVCQEMGVDYRVLPSGAGHDARVMADLAPAAMILVRNKSGISHSPAEWVEMSDIVLGVQVLTNTVLKLDDALAQRRGEGKHP